MKSGSRRLISLVLVFVGAFLAVFLIRNGPDGFRRFFSADGSADGYRPETFTLPEKAPLDLGKVELLSRLNEEYATLTAAVRPSVVSIDTSGVRRQRIFDGYGRQLIRPVPTQGQGSGVIVTHEGHVVTNQHVISGQNQIQVTLYDGRSFEADLIGEDSLLDIAVLKIRDGGDFDALKFGDSSIVRPGQLVLALGNPFGLGQTVTQGIISARERSLSDTQRDLFQTDAAINPGNSGGPLVNLQGEIIGINSAIFRPDQRVNSGFQGVGFSIPSDDVRDALYDILERGRPIHGYLGVQILDLTSRLRRATGYSGSGVLVLGVGENSPAERAGLRSGDILVRFDGRDLESRAQLFTRVQRTKVGETVKLGIWREGEELELEAVIAEARPDTDSRRSTAEDGPRRSREEVLETVGVVVRDAAVNHRRRVVVAEIRPDSLADGKLQSGDIIVTLNRVPVVSSRDFYLQLAASASAQTTQLQILRSGDNLRIDLPPVPDEPEDGP